MKPEETASQGETPGQIEGRFLGRGVTCEHLQRQNGEAISLMGLDFSAIQLGKDPRLTGGFVFFSPSTQGRTFEARTKEPLPKA